MIMEGTMSDCNSDGETWGGAIVNYPGSTGGMLHVENVTIENAYKNLYRYGPCNMLQFPT
jgi:hypothetical protein